MNTIDNLRAIYRNTAEEAGQELKKVQQKIYRTGTLRLLLFVAGVAGIIYFRSESWMIPAGIALITLLPFLFLMKYHNRLFHRKDYLEKKMEINEQELAALDYDTYSFDDGEAYIDPTHLYTYDLDVFGPHSLFQYINRTCTQPGKHRPARLITSLRTSDSLNDNESYFFAELKRLKLIIDKLHAGEKLFIILDEILKGTNSMDKQKGSFALIKQFMALQANGIIATHDLLLGTLADLFPDHIRNFCFEADITDNELAFSYCLRPGVAQNMNACFLMKKMGIAVAD